MLILNQLTGYDFIDRLNKLNANSLPLWGKMNAAQMLKHMRVALELPLGKIEMKPNWFFKLLFGQWIKKKVLDDSIYKAGTPTAKEFVVKSSDLDFELEKKKLLDALSQFNAMDDFQLGSIVHPLFGTMNAYQWRRSQWKHFDHHWRQFGI